MQTIPVPLIVTFLLTNGVKSQISVSASNHDQVHSEVDLATQIRQIQTTSEASPRTASGSNLQASDLRLYLQPIYFTQHEKNANKNLAKEGNNQSEALSYGNKNEKGTSDGKINHELKLTPLALIKNDCAGSTLKDTINTNMRAQNNMEHENINMRAQNYMEHENINMRAQNYMEHENINMRAQNNMENENINMRAQNYMENENINMRAQNYMENENINMRAQNDLEHENIVLQEPLTPVPNSWYKRNANHSEALHLWLEKYEKNLNPNYESRHQEPVIIRKFPETSTQSPTTTVKIITITKEVFRETTHVELESKEENENEEEYNDIRVRVGQTEDWFEAEDRSNIGVRGPPRSGNHYLIPRLQLEGGFYPFAFMSQFFSLVYPFEFPVGLIKDIFWGKFSFPYSFLQSIHVESTFLGFIIAFSCLSLVIPSYLLILCFLSLLSNSSCGDEAETGTLFPDAEDTDCNGLVVFTLFSVLFCCMLIAGMAVSSEQASSAASISRDAITCAFSDVATWLSTAANELHHSVAPPIDRVVQTLNDDLRNVETLLGEPIQQAIASESGIDLVLDSLTDVITECEDLSSKISSLRDMSNRAGSIASSATDKVRDLARQIDNLKKNCNFKDAPLCDTINTNSLEVYMRFDLILREQHLLELRSLGVENMTRSISQARQEFRALPTAVTVQTADIREAIIRHMELRRQEVHSSSRVLHDIARHLSTTLHTGLRYIDVSLNRVDEYEFWRWSFMLACEVLLVFLMMMILMAILCGCGKDKKHAKRTLQLSTVWICVTSLLLWAVVSAVFLVAGHAEVFICRALWNSPNYDTLAALFDRPSPFLTNNDGVFDALFKDMDNVTIDVSVTDVIRECERDQPAYTVFRLDRLLDVNKATSYFEWDELQDDLRKLPQAIDVGFLKTLSADFNRLLTEMLEISDVDLAKYRGEYNSPIMGKDLPSLGDQLEYVAAQVTDLTTAGRLETLATRTQRLHITSIKPLEQLRADLVYKLTELELQLQPFRRKLNISLSHLHTAQYYIDNQGDDIAQKKASTFVSRLESHAAAWRTHVLEAVENKAARCRPLFDVYAGLRGLLCSRYVASLHGWWVCGFFLGLFWCTLVTPLCVKLLRSYDERIKADNALAMAHLNTTHHQQQQGTPTTIIMCESNSNWDSNNTPGPPPPPRDDSW